MRQFILYCLCGGLGVSTDYLVFFLSVTAGLWYQGANLLGYLAGTLLSFALNRVLTFGMRDRVAQRLAMFLGVAAIGFGASAALLALLVDVLHFDPRIAKLLTLPMVVVLQFTLNRKLTFNAAQRAAASN
ncbi:GtrA family protein [Pseudoduganella sp. FT55W]|uniref:GtrA family protein n=1 Tax=Duganella rivi TaxID=2666083 RepID=A0A7X4GUF1_9BURK|nr:GtrA family protein [Duganella rivi]MYM68837.1 GtrA family protein [Duganella rivi]